MADLKQKKFQYFHQKFSKFDQINTKIFQKYFTLHFCHKNHWGTEFLFFSRNWVRGGFVNQNHQRINAKTGCVESRQNKWHEIRESFVKIHNFSLFFLYCRFLTGSGFSSTLVYVCASFVIQWQSFLSLNLKKNYYLILRFSFLFQKKIYQKMSSKFTGVGLSQGEAARKYVR